MNKNNNNKASVITKVIRKANKRNRKLRRKLRRLNRRGKAIFRSRRNQAGRSMGVASTKLMPKYYYVTRSDGSSCRVKGCDLVYSIPDSLVTENDTQVIAVIPSNPIYWTGTRMSALAAGYQNFRPLSFEVYYVPEIAVTQPGNVIGGTLWNMVPNSSVLQQTLKTSNGGVITQCYAPAVSKVRMKTNLQFNLFRIGGDINQESVPFIYLALAIACKDVNGNRVVPGWFYIKYDYILKNPIGNSINYKNYGMVEYSDDLKIMANSSLYLCNNIPDNKLQLNIGTRLDLEYNSDSSTIDSFYNSTKVTIPSGTLVWLLGNENLSESDDVTPEPEQEKLQIKYYVAGVKQGSTQNVINGRVIIYQDTDYYYSVVNLSGANFNFAYPTGTFGTIIYECTDPYQDFGKLYDNIANGIIRFIASKSKYQVVKVDSVKVPQLKLVDYGIIGKDSKEEDFDSSKVNVSD